MAIRSCNPKKKILIHAGQWIELQIRLTSIFRIFLGQKDNLIQKIYKLERIIAIEWFFLNLSILFFPIFLKWDNPIQIVILSNSLEHSTLFLKFIWLIKNILSKSWLNFYHTGLQLLDIIAARKDHSSP